MVHSAHPQRLKPHAEQCGYRSDESLRHPKPNAMSNFSAACKSVPYPTPGGICGSHGNGLA
jgi:hypothetical protein